MILLVLLVKKLNNFIKLIYLNIVVNGIENKWNVLNVKNKVIMQVMVVVVKKLNIVKLIVVILLVLMFLLIIV